MNPKDKIQKLSHQIEFSKKKIVTDAYPMSIGEVINLYQDDEIDIHPEFQRFYRWDEYQKSNLIESILLGIPLPSFFVSQREDGVWDLVDGLQRIATILSFVGIYKNENKESLHPLVLKGTKYLTELEGVRWQPDEEKPADTQLILPKHIQLEFKRYKIDFKIIKNSSDSNAKYDMFERLNTGGSQLEGQEVRNCLLVMINKKGYDFIQKLSEDKNFQNCTPITDRKIDESYRQELVLRFLVYNYILKTLNDVKPGNVDEFLNDKMTEMFNPAEHIDYTDNKEKFIRIFEVLNNKFGENAFKLKVNDSFKGGFILSRFEIICSYILKNFSKIDNLDLEKLTDDLAGSNEYQNATERGTNALSRTKKLIKYARDLEL